MDRRTKGKKNYQMSRPKVTVGGGRRERISKKYRRKKGLIAGFLSALSSFWRGLFGGKKHERKGMPHWKIGRANTRGAFGSSKYLKWKRTWKDD